MHHHSQNTAQGIVSPYLWIFPRYISMAFMLALNKSRTWYCCPVFYQEYNCSSKHVNKSCGLLTSTTDNSTVFLWSQEVPILHMVSPSIHQMPFVPLRLSPCASFSNLCSYSCHASCTFQYLYIGVETMIWLYFRQRKRARISPEDCKGSSSSHK
jgi:hypothetical protein